MHPPDTFVSVDLETTGLDPAMCEIIEIGAVKVQKGEIVAEFSELVKPGRPIPDFITALTGIEEKDVRSASPLDVILPSFLDFIRGYRMLAQNAAFDVAFLRKAVGVGSVPAAIDNIELARILLPRLSSYSLDSLIDFFALSPGNRHRALDDARVTAEVFLRLIGMLRLVPDHFLRELASIASHGGGALAEIFESHLLERADAQYSRPADIPVRTVDGEYHDNMYGDFDVEPAQREEQAAAIEPDRVSEILEEGGSFSAHFPDYEQRPGQIAFARRVTGAFNDAEILVAEAGTGTGKSLAYLLPGILWAEKAQERIIISTNTKNLQEQLFHKDIPLLGQILDFPFRAVIVKGRGNYICLSRWRRLVDKPSKYLSKEERGLLLPIASWLRETTTGDLSETGFFTMMMETGLLEKINSESISCHGGRCPSRDECYVNRIRRAAQKAHIIIVNHSLVFSDMVADGGVLGGYSRIVFDEAHNLEKVAMRYLGINVDYFRVRRILNRLYSGENKGYGLLAVLSEWVREYVRAYPDKTDTVSIVDTAVEMEKAVRSAAMELFRKLGVVVQDIAGKSGEDGGHEGKMRFFAGSPVFAACADEATVFLDSLNRLFEAVGDCVVMLSGLSTAHIRDKDDMQIDLEKCIQDIQMLVDDFQVVREAGGKNVYWFDYTTGGNPLSLKIRSAPLDVADKLAIGLYDHMETIVMTSATLAVARDFSYIEKRLGLDLDTRDRIREFIADSPFDYDRQAALVMPTFVPSPKHGNFIPESNEVLFRIAEDTRRGMLVLFTSRGHLQRAYHELRDRFERSGIPLMAQGIDGSRSLLLRRFREETHSVLFGTDSFWEGVDVPGKALEVVVISRLPFAVPTDPVIQAQMEEVERTGGRSFLDFSVPEAAIKLRQGAGRLIRHRHDRGVIVVMDTRIVTARYGSIFRRSLPGREIKVPSADRMTDVLRQWFGVPEPGEGG